MDVRTLVLAYAVAGIASCVLAVTRRARASLACASAGSACLGALGLAVAGWAGAAGCLALAVIVAIWLATDQRHGTGAPSGPLATLLATGLYLCGAAGNGEGAVVALVCALAAWVLGSHAAQLMDAYDMAVLSLALLALGLLDGSGVIHAGGMALDVASLACPPLAVTLARALGSHGERRRELPLALLSAVGALLCVEAYAELCALALAGVTFLVAGSARRGRAALCAGVLVALAWAVCLALSVPQLRGWLGAWDDPYGAGYQLALFREVLAEAAPLGTGDVSALALSIPRATDTYVLAQAASALGWVGIALPIVCAISAVAASLRSCAGAHARRAMTALLATFALFAMVNVAYVFHLAPVPSLPFPLLSAGFGQLVSFAGAGGALARLSAGEKNHDGAYFRNENRSLEARAALNDFGREKKG